MQWTQRMWEVRQPHRQMKSRFFEFESYQDKKKRKRTSREAVVRKNVQNSCFDSPKSKNSVIFTNKCRSQSVCASRSKTFNIEFHLPAKRIQKMTTKWKMQVNAFSSAFHAVCMNWNQAWQDSQQDNWPKKGNSRNRNVKNFPRTLQTVNASLSIWAKNHQEEKEENTTSPCILYVHKKFFRPRGRRKSNACASWSKGCHQPLRRHNWIFERLI